MNIFENLAKENIDFYIQHKSSSNILDDVYTKDKRIFKYIVTQSKVTYENNKDMNNFYNDRANALQKIFQLTIDHFHIQKHLIFYVYMGDELPEKYSQYPIFTFAKKEKENGILIPDWSFINPYTSKISKSWDDLKTEMYEKCPKKIKYTNVFYFRGRNTSSNTKHNLRKKLYNLSKEYSFLDIQLNPTNEQKISDWCQYKYMLDLPGSSPWSIRFKELFLLRSVVVKINVDSNYINFYTKLFEKNVDYLNINFTKNNFEHVKKELKNIFENVHDKQYKTIMLNGRKKIKLLTMSNILIYMNTIFQNYESCLLNTQTIYDQEIFDTTRPCSSSSRQKNRYTKDELMKIIQTYYNHIHIHKKMTINELCHLLSFQKKIVHQNISSQKIFLDFQKEFESELIGWISKKQSKFRVMLKGGQNLKLMLTQKYKKTRKCLPKFTLDTIKEFSLGLLSLQKIHQILLGAFLVLP
jgi:hypothetical protein